MLRQFAARVQPRVRAQGSRLLSAQSSKFGAIKAQVQMPRRSMATVKVEGIPKVGYTRLLFCLYVLEASLLSLRLGG